MFTRPQLRRTTRTTLYFNLTSPDTRVAEIFRKTWLRLPIDVRQSLLCYFRREARLFYTPHSRRPHPDAAESSHVVITIAPCNPSDKHVCIGFSMTAGLNFYFEQASLNIMSDVLVELAIAWQLSAIYNRASLLEYPYIREKSALKSSDFDRQWGFDTELLDEWMKQNPVLPQTQDTFLSPVIADSTPLPGQSRF